MLWKIIALAVAGLVSGGAFAQANVTVSGNIGVSYDQYTLGGATVGRTTYRQNMVTDHSSAIILKGEENLGNGMTAWFQIDSRLTMDRGRAAASQYGQPYTTSGLGDGNTAIGLKGNFGTVGIGRWDAHYDAFAAIESYGAGALAARVGYFGIMAQVAGAQIALGSRAANLMFYDTPTWNGFNARIAYSTAAGGGEGEGAQLVAGGSDPGAGRAIQLRANYANGPVAAVFSYFNHRIEDRNSYTACAAAPTTLALTCPPTLTAAPNPADQRSTRLGVAYTFPMGLKVGLGWDRSEVSNNAAVAAGATGAPARTAGNFTRTAWMLPIKYSMGNHDLHWTYAKAGNTTNVGGSNGATQNVFAYGYNFSKRTSIGVQYITVSNSSEGVHAFGAVNAGTGYQAVQAGEDPKLISFNVRHFF
jgi:predicted porin